MRTRGLWLLLQVVSRFWICSGVFSMSNWFLGKPRDGGVVKIGQTSRCPSWQMKNGKVSTRSLFFVGEKGDGGTACMISKARA